MRPRPWFSHLALALLCLSLLSRPARAAEDFDRSLAEALRLYQSLEYEAALAALERARQAASDDARAAQVSLYEGAILADLGRREDARRAFRKGLLLDPDARLPMLAPKVARELESVRTRVRRERAVARAREPKAPPPVGVSPPPPPVEDRPEQPAAPDLTPPPPPAVALVPEVRAPARRVSPVPLVLLGTGVVAGGVGGYFGWSSRGQVAAAREATQQSEAATRLEQARGNALVANVLLGTAGVAAASAVVSWLLLREDVTEPEPSGAAP